MRGGAMVEIDDLKVAINKTIGVKTKGSSL
jgi:hypothetical protein